MEDYGVHSIEQVDDCEHSIPKVMRFFELQWGVERKIDDFALSACDAASYFRKASM